MVGIRRRARALVLVAAPLAAAGACHRGESYEKPVTPVRVAVVERAGAPQALRYSATIEPETRVDVAFKRGGYVRTLGAAKPIEEGDRVAAGSVLATIAPEDYDVKVQQARAQLAEAESAHTQAAQALSRADALFAAKSLTRPELEQAQAAAAMTDAKVAGARALIREAEQARADATLRSPIDGIVLKRLVERGSLVGPGTPGFVLGHTRTVKVVFGVPDTMLPRVPAGTRLTVVTEAYPDRRLSGRVTKVAPAADPRSRVFDVEVSIPNADGALKPGMVAAVDLDEASGAPRPLLLPLAAVVRSPARAGAYAVFVVDDRGGQPVAKAREVRLGSLVGNEIEVLEGVRDGDHVIVSGATVVTDGERVNPTR